MIREQVLGLIMYTTSDETRAPQANVKLLLGMGSKLILNHAGRALSVALESQASCDASTQ